MNRDQWIAVLLAIAAHGIVLFLLREPPTASPVAAAALPVEVNLVAAVPGDAPPTETSKTEPVSVPSIAPTPSPIQAPSPVPLAMPTPAPTSTPTAMPTPTPVPPTTTTPTPTPTVATPFPKPKASPRFTPVEKAHSKPSSAHERQTPSRTPAPPRQPTGKIRQSTQSAGKRAEFHAGSAAGSMGDVAPSYLSHPQPDYPGEAKENGRQGMVMLDVLVSAEGRPVKVALARSSGTPELDQAALAAVRQWTFRPGRRAGVPAAAHALVPVRFELEP